jgi:lysozyme family protein
MPFDTAYNKTMGYEGGYANDPVDPGGETYKGISRRFHPNWSGWKIIDMYKSRKNFISDLYRDKYLDKLTRDFYKEKFWDSPGINLIDDISPEMAEKLFDTGINVGMQRASKWFQSTLNLLNRNQKRYPDISVDGMIGPTTAGTFKKALESNPLKRIMTVFAIHQGEHYKAIMERDKTQERYVGWFDRLDYK